MAVTLAMNFTAVRDARATAVLGFLLQLPALSEGAAADADVGLDRHGRFLVLRLRLSDTLLSAAILDRLQFWCARAGGLAAGALSANMPGRLEGLLRDASSVLRGVDATRLGELVGPILVEQCGARPESSEPEIPPVLRLQVGGPGWAGVTYDPGARALFVPTPLAPAIGDAFVVELEETVPYRSVLRAPARVASAFLRGAAGVKVGFTATLEGAFEAAHQTLANACAEAAEPKDTRTMTRVPVSAPVGVAGQEGVLTDLSQGGAYIRTSRPAGVGTDVRVDVRLPNASALQTTATVVHASASGMGVRFQLDPEGSTVLASAVTSMTARRPQALVVDDDALTLKMMADAFEEQGYDVLTAPDAEFAMHALADRLLSLDLLVTDVLMPGVDGVQLVSRIRRIGGEGDLPIVAVSGRVDEGLEAMLKAAGADAVLSKSIGAEAIVRSASEALAKRRPPEAERAVAEGEATG